MTDKEMSAEDIEEMLRIDAERAFISNTELHNFLQRNRKEILELARDGIRWRELDPTYQQLHSFIKEKRTR